MDKDDRFKGYGRTLVKVVIISYNLLFNMKKIVKLRVPTKQGYIQLCKTAVRPMTNDGAFSHAHSIEVLGLGY